MSPCLARMAVEVRTTADPRAKTALSRRHAAAWHTSRDGGAPMDIGSASPPDAPARPDRSALRSPRDLPRRKSGTPEGRVALLHAITQSSSTPSTCIGT